MTIRVIKLVHGSAIVASALLCVGVGAQGGASERDEVDWAKERRFWSFQRPLAHALPPVKLAMWPQQRLDHFVLNRMERQGLEPSPAVDRRTLIRRVTF